MNQIYVDMDGVLADFEAAILALYGREGLDAQAHRDDFWKRLCVEDRVFTHMKPIEEGLRMVADLRNAGIPVCILTSTGGMPHHNDIACQKLFWLRMHGLADVPVAFCMNTKGKGAYASAGAVLIDDRAKVLDEWYRWGGVGELFTRDQAAAIAQDLTSLHKRKLLFSSRYYAQL